MDVHPSLYRLQLSTRFMAFFLIEPYFAIIHGSFCQLPLTAPFPLPSPPFLAPDYDLTSRLSRLPFSMQMRQGQAWVSQHRFPPLVYPLNPLLAIPYFIAPCHNPLANLFRVFFSRFPLAREICQPQLRACVSIIARAETIFGIFI